MKKLLFIFLGFLIPLVLQAQTEHMKFMGIPLNGSITSFQSKLQAKGIKYDPTISRQLNVGCRCYKGTFSGEKADFYVYYNEKTLIVYRAKAVITCINLEQANRGFESFKSMLEEKYSDGITDNGQQYGHPALSIVVPDSKHENILGEVDLYMTNPSYSYMDEVYLHIDYVDFINKKANESRKMDDL